MASQYGSGQTGSHCDSCIIALAAKPPAITPCRRLTPVRGRVALSNQRRARRVEAVLARLLRGLRRPNTLGAATLLADNWGRVDMQRSNDILTTSHVPTLKWRKSRYSNPCGSCVELARRADGGITIRNSRHPGGPVLIYSRAGMAAFIHGIKAGEFD